MQWIQCNDQYLYLLLADSSKPKLLDLLGGIEESVNRQLHDAKMSFQLQPLGDITPGPDLENAIGPDTDLTLLGVFVTICLLILIPACFNYANLSIARALKRYKEIGLRKTLGGKRRHIFSQFITETVAIVVLSLLGAVLIFFVIRPEFEDMMPGSWLDLTVTFEMIAMFLLFAIVTGFLTGVFPATYFARLSPIEALKGKLNTTGFSRMRIRRALIVFQFALSFCFIVLLIVFGRQYRYNLNFNYGFNTDNILDVQLQDVNQSTLRNEFTRLAAIQNLSMSSHILGISSSQTYARNYTANDSIEVFQIFCDSRFVDNMGLQLVAGEDFSDGLGNYARYILVNEEFIRSWQISDPRKAIGRSFIVNGKELEVRGVLKNFHFAPLQVPIKGFLLRNDPTQFKYANLKIASPDMQTTRSEIEELWGTLSSRKFEGRFFDDEMEEMYQFYRSLLKMIGFLGLIAISITLLGLLGMVIYTVEPRTKEVGIRKVFGANEANITSLLSKDFLKLMLWAIAFAIPLNTLFVDEFLSALQYYRITLGVWDVALSLLLFGLIGVTTILSQTLKAARANPIDTLRHE
jgi:ABC-type antimicrobial peptide transport system permease subunit